ncbi:MAG: lysophospholipid acyltransferase family protein [Ignavibacteriaceae bacterium]
MTDKIEYIIFIAFSFLFKLCGIKLSRKFSSVLALTFFYLIPIRKKTTIENLSNAFPEYSPNKIKQIAFRSYKSFAIALIEILFIPWMKREDIINSIKCSNINMVREKYNENKGMILLTAHFGNWEFMALSLGLQAGLPFSVVVKTQRNTLVSDWLNRMRSKWGNKTVPLGISIRQIYKELKDKNIVAMVADQRGPSDGVRVNFFGRKTAVYSGPAVLALKTNAPILYAISVRQPDSSYTCEFNEIKTNGLPENEEHKIIELNQRMSDFLEGYIRKYPEQWLWMHKRWKY